MRDWCLPVLNVSNVFVLGNPVNNVLVYICFFQFYYMCNDKTTYDQIHILQLLKTTRATRLSHILQNHDVVFYISKPDASIKHFVWKDIIEEKWEERAYIKEHFFLQSQN